VSGDAQRKQRQQNAAREWQDSPMHRPDHNKTRFGFVGALGEQYAAQLAARYPGVEAVPAVEGDFPALVVWDLDVAATIRAIEQQPNVAWVHLRWAGVPEAVIEALRSGHLGGFALDTLYEEPGRPDDELLSFDNVVLTPHMAGSPRTNGLQDIQDMIEGLASALAG